MADLNDIEHTDEDNGGSPQGRVDESLHVLWENIDHKPSNLGGGFSSYTRVHLSANQAIGVALTNIKIQFNTKNWDNGLEFDPVTFFRFTANAAGKYTVILCLAFDSSAVGESYTASIFKNGVLASYASQVAGGGGGPSVVIVDDISLAAGDYLEFYGACSVSTRNVLATYTYAAIKRFA